MDKRIRRIEIAGGIFIFIAGFILHNAYQMSGESSILSIFSLLKESIWEHSKLVFWPAIIYMVIEFVLIKGKGENILVGKTLGVIIAQIVFITLNHLYHAYGKEILNLQNDFIIHILVFIIAIVICQAISYYVIIKNQISNKYVAIAIIAILLNILLFLAFMQAPPNHNIFIAKLNT